MLMFDQPFEDPAEEPDFDTPLDDACQRELDRIVREHTRHYAEFGTLKSEQATIERQIDRLISQGRFDSEHPTSEAAQLACRLQFLRVAITKWWAAEETLTARLHEFIP